MFRLVFILVWWAGLKSVASTSTTIEIVKENKEHTASVTVVAINKVNGAVATGSVD